MVNHYFDSTDVQGVMDELELMLVPSGRMNERNRAIVADAYADMLKIKDKPSEALDNALQVFTATGDFQASPVNSHKDGKREEFEQPEYLERDYKAIVYLYLEGGVDSWNILVPHSGCNGTGANHVRAQYESIRGDVALDKDELFPIDSGNPDQPCTTFGIHGSLETPYDLYEDGDALFMANIGPLIEPCTKEEYQDGAKQLPNGLFAHNTQTQQVSRCKLPGFRRIWTLVFCSGHAEQQTSGGSPCLQYAKLYPPITTHRCRTARRATPTRRACSAASWTRLAVPPTRA